ncbi:hypothetical protein Afe04nite_70020 [Asanoa ferruginea]|uniref:RusA family crossover junction endodeoxyribonuclease n=1 Tax=Asanoa ferruginea TaxID=53367 RepID=UPI000E26F696|nr:RusA family crossover junction endodeoxyribonuclease [Asanoa ferruginea]GIF52463.1 hypothetical protein Afe04nite_70020 [Asanoa ferruginea]
MRFETLIIVNVVGRPASYSTSAEAAWKDAVREAVAQTGVGPWTARLSILLAYSTPEARNTNEVWDLDNLIKPTIDALEGILGLRPQRGRTQVADDQVDHLEASKRTVRSDEVPGARIEIRRLIT